MGERPTWTSKSGAGRYWNVVRSDGRIDSNLCSYNQGVMVGTNVLRYLVTANNTYLTQAVGGIANKSLTHYGNFGGGSLLRLQRAARTQHLR